INYWNKQEEEHNDKSIDVVHDHINFNTTSTSATYTLSLHDALPIYHLDARLSRVDGGAEKESGDTSPAQRWVALAGTLRDWARRSEEHTSELQSREKRVCRLLLEKKKKSYYCTHAAQL